MSAAGTADPVGAAAVAVSAPSLSTIVTVPVPVTIEAPLAFERTTANVSVGSAVLLLTIETWKICDVTPGLNVSVCVFAWKSVTACADPATVDAVTVTVDVAGPSSVIVTFTVEVPVSPSVIVAFPTERPRSSFRIVTTPVPSARFRPIGFESRILNVSFGS